MTQTDMDEKQKAHCRSRLKTLPQGYDREAVMVKLKDKTNREVASFFDDLHHFNILLSFRDATVSALLSNIAAQAEEEEKN